MTKSEIRQILVQIALEAQENCAIYIPSFGYFNIFMYETHDTAVLIFNNSIKAVNQSLANPALKGNMTSASLTVERRKNLKMFIDASTFALQQAADDLFPDFEDQVTLGNLMGYLDDYLLEVEELSDENFELFWSIHNPDKSTDLEGNLESARNLN